jgi:hypothetical protein
MTLVLLIGVAFVAELVLAIGVGWWLRTKAGPR